MKNEGKAYWSDEGKLIVRKSDNSIMGDCIYLGIGDSIDNYGEYEFTEDAINAFNESVRGKIERNVAERPVSHTLRERTVNRPRRSQRNNNNTEETE